MRSRKPSLISPGACASRDAARAADQRARAARMERHRASRELHLGALGGHGPGLRGQRGRSREALAAGDRIASDSAEVARHLARRFRTGSETDDLARVAEHVSLTEGRVDLCRTLRELLGKPDGAPSSAHCSVARLPGLVGKLGRECSQLVITTNYDSALERAFDAVHEPYDLVVFVASGGTADGSCTSPGRIRTVAAPEPITVPNEYVELPDRRGRRARAHGHRQAPRGAVRPRARLAAPRDNFVVTEDDYIGYLTRARSRA